MPLLSRKADYALLILSHLHQRPEGACAREVANRFQLSRAFVANILKELCHKGFVTSHRGVKGGYELSRPASGITLGDLIDALDEVFRFAECNQESPDDGCSLVHVCPLRGPVAEIHHRIREVLNNLTLADVFDRHGLSELHGLPAELLSLTLPEPCAAPLAP